MAAAQLLQPAVQRAVPAWQSDLIPLLEPDSVPQQGFPRRARLIKTDEFSSVFNFRKRITGRYLVAYYSFSQLAHARLGLIVGKKTAAAAVKRNYMRRVLRELFRKQPSNLDGMDILIRAQQPFGHKEYPLIEEEFLSLVDKLAQARTRSSANG